MIGFRISAWEHRMARASYIMTAAMQIISDGHTMDIGTYIRCLCSTVLDSSGILQCFENFKNILKIILAQTYHSTKVKVRS